MPALRVALFDLGGVVCRFDHAPRLAALAEDCGLPAEEVDARVWAAGLMRDYDAGRYTDREWFELVRELLRLRMDFERFCEVILLPFSLDRDVLALAGRVRPDVRTAMLSDNFPLLLDALPSRFPEVAARFDPILFSCDLRALKPSREAFEAALDRLGEPADRVFFVDDNPANVEGARSLGIDAEQFTTPPALEAALAARGVLA